MIHVGMPVGGSWEYLGAFRVLGEAADEGIGESIEYRERTLALRRIQKDSELARELEEAGYQPDPKLDVFTGWSVEGMPADLSPNFAALFGGHGQNAICQMDEPLLSSPPSLASAPKIPLASARGSSAIGIDWSGATNAGRKIWAATLVPDSAGLRPDQLVRPFLSSSSRDAVCSHFATWLSAKVERARAAVVGLDFCFSVASRHTAALHVTKDDPRTLAAIIRGDTPDQFKIRLGAEEKRATDYHFRSPFAPTNLRMFRQMHLGIRCLGTLSSAFAILPWESPREGMVPVVEVLPAHVVREIVRAVPYKERAIDRCAPGALTNPGRGAKTCSACRRQQGRAHHRGPSRGGRAGRGPRSRGSTCCARGGLSRPCGRCRPRRIHLRPLIRVPGVRLCAPSPNLCTCLSEAPHIGRNG